MIPIEGVSREEWLEVAPFWHPVKQPAVVKNWEQAELLLKVGSKYDLQPVLHAADAYITANVGKLKNQPWNDVHIWKWVVLADQSCLQTCLPLLAKQAVMVDRVGCSEAGNLQSLSAPTLRQLLTVLSCKHVETKCTTCNCDRSHSVVLQWNCTACRRCNATL